MRYLTGDNTQMKKRIGSLLLTLFVLAFVAPAAQAQSMFATLTGTVQDSGGAVVVGAGVTVKNAASGETRTTTTNRAGYFSVTELPAATYLVLVSGKGFENYRETGIALTGGADLSINIQLKVGAANETVEVVGQRTDLSPTTSGEKSYTISEEDLEQVSLDSRDATEIVNIMPGSVMTPNGAVNGQAFSGQANGMNTTTGPLANENVNGQGVDVTMDGGHTFDPGAFGNAVPVTANQDMIAEVKILTSNFTADNPKGPVVVNTVSKSGGSNFHGDLHFVARNHVLDSIDSYEKENGITSTPNEHYYYPGGTIGGPVFIPHTRINKNRNKLFFFDGYEFYNQIQDGGIDTAFLPTAAMLSGDFSKVASYGTNVAGGSILTTTPTTPNWATGAFGGPWVAGNPKLSVSADRLLSCTITGGKLGPSCMDPNGVALLTAYTASLQPFISSNGAPNAQGFNYAEDIIQPMNMWQNLARVDFDYSDKSKLYVTFDRQHQTATWPNGYWVGSSSENYVPSPSTIIGDDWTDFVNVNLMRVISPSMTSETRFSYTFENYPGDPSDPAKMQRYEIPGFKLGGIYKQPTAPDLVTWGAGFPDLGDVGHTYPLICYKKMPAASEDLTKVIRTHTVKGGIYWEFLDNVQTTWNQWGDFSYGNWAPAVTGNMYADALMGIGHTGYTEYAVPPEPPNNKENIISFYAQDDWKVTRRLTLQYGLRFDHYGKPYSTPYGAAQFNPATYNNSPSAVGLNTGVSWNLINSKVPLAGTTSTALFYSPRIGAAYDLFGNGRTIVRGGYGQYRTFDLFSFGSANATSEGSVGYTCGWNDPNCPTWEDVDTHSAGPAIFGAGLPAATLASPNTINTVNPHDHEQPLTTTYSVTIDQKLPGKMNIEGSYVGNHSTDFQTEVNVNAVPLGAMIGNPCANVASAQATECVQKYRPYQNYQDIDSTTTAGKSRFDSLQMSLQRNTGFLTLMVNYTYSKALGDGVLGTDSTSGYKDLGVNEMYGVLPLDRPNVLSTVYVVHMPKLHGSNAIARGAVNGWELSGITQIESGANLTSGAGSSGWGFGYSPVSNPAKGSLAYNNTALLGSPDITLMPLLTCDPRKGNPKGVFLNASCFGVPKGNGVNGTTKLPYLPGPKYWKSDLTAIKNFKIREHQNAQFRVGAFNFLNHALLSFAPGDSDLYLNNLAFDTTTGGETNLNPNFGKALWHYGHRIVELEAKYSF
jgi:hypothetical protein